MGAGQSLFLLAGILMLVDAVGYTFGALFQIRKKLASGDRYWDRRLLLNLMLANAGLYFTSFIALLGVQIRSHDVTDGNYIALLCLLICAYSLVTVVLVTPSDWKH